jgi:TolB-like protein
MDTLYRFAGATFEPKAGVLTVAGRSANLRPRTAAVLAYLLERPGKLAIKDDLLREVWSDLVVTENSLAQCVKEIRKELGDAHETLLRTVHRRGYVLEAEVTCSTPGDQAGQADGRANAKRLSIMVLPLENVGGDPEQDYFAEGLTEDLTTNLGRIPSAFVISRGTAQVFHERRADAREIGSQLGVRYLVEGSVRRSAGEVVVNLSLSETHVGRQLWAERFEGRRENLAALHRSMASRITQALHIELFNAESERIGGESVDPDAHDLAMRAWSLWYRAAPAPRPECKALVNRALELDAHCTLAWVVRANLNLMDLSARSTPDPAKSLDDAEAAARRALELDPDHPTANTSFAAVMSNRGRFEEALEALERQMALNPNFAVAHQWTGMTHILMGNPQLAIGPLETAIALSPRDPRLSAFIRNVALAHLHLGNDARALILAERSVHVPRPWPRSYETLAAAYAVSDLMDDARAVVAVLLQQWPGYTIAVHRAEMMSDRPAFLAQRERLLDGLRSAGLPEA